MRRTGIEVIGDVPWGTHFCQFYQHKQDLIDILVPYFTAGLEANEFCMWVTSEPLAADEAAAALAEALGDLTPYLQSGQLEILSYDQWYTLDGAFSMERVLQGWVDKLTAARARGFAGLRLTGNTFWLEASDWQDFTDYEAAINGVIGQYPMLAMCTYSLTRCGAVEIMDVVSNHAFALIKRAGSWQIIESAERKKVEASLRESEQRYRSLFNGMTEGFALHEIICDEHGAPCDYRFLEINPAFERLTGLRQHEVIGRTVRETLPTTEDYWIALYGKVALTGETMQYENYSTALDRYYEVFAYRPAPGQFAVLFIDITDRKRADESLRQVNRTLLAYNHSDQALLRATDETAYLQAVCRIITEDCGYAMVWVGYAENDPEHSVRPVAHAGFEEGYLDTLRISWADTERGRGPTGTAIRTGTVYACRNMQTDPAFLPWRAEAERRGYAASVVFPLRDANRVFGALSIYSREPDPFSDEEMHLLKDLADDFAAGIVTLRLRAAKARAEEQQQILLHMVSHDLRAPMAIIHGHAELIADCLGEAGDPELVRESLRAIRRGIMRMDAMVDDLTDVARLEGGQLQLECKPLAIAGYLSDLLRRSKSVLDLPRFILQVPEDLPPVQADADRLDRILTNLLTNAQKYSEPGTPVRVRALPQPGEVVISVADQGRGISPEDLPHLFSRFYRAKGARRADSIGLGLYITRLLVEAHDGRVWVESTPGKGSTFSFTLPTA